MRHDGVGLLPNFSQMPIVHPRPCLRDAIPEIAVAARQLDDAVTAHLSGRPVDAEELFRIADMNAMRDWTESIWGRKPDIVEAVSMTTSSTATPDFPRDRSTRAPAAPPTSSEQHAPPPGPTVTNRRGPSASADR